MIFVLKFLISIFTLKTINKNALSNLFPIIFQANFSAKCWFYVFDFVVVVFLYFYCFFCPTVRRGSMGTKNKKTKNALTNLFPIIFQANFSAKCRFFCFFKCFFCPTVRRGSTGTGTSARSSIQTITIFDYYNRPKYLKFRENAFGMSFFNESRLWSHIWI